MSVAYTLITFLAGYFFSIIIEKLKKEPNRLIKRYSPLEPKLFLPEEPGRYLLSELKKSMGNPGEQQVISIINSNITPDRYHLINNVTLPIIGGGTTQIDHILVSQYGIFVIETKDYSGWIFGSEDNKNWTQTFPNQRHQFQNPLHQNSWHIKQLHKHFDFLPKNAFKSIVVFTDKCTIKTKIPGNVLKTTNLIEYINSFNSEVISKNRIYFIVGKIQVLSLPDSIETDALHINNLNTNFNKINQDIAA